MCLVSRARAVTLYQVSMNEVSVFFAKLMVSSEAAYEADMQVGLFV